VRKDAARIRTKAGIPALLVDIGLIDMRLSEIPHENAWRSRRARRGLAKDMSTTPKHSSDCGLGGYLHTEGTGIIQPSGWGH
jgi:hypothetical protein